MITKEGLSIGNYVMTQSEETEVIQIDMIDSIEETIHGNALEDIPFEDLDYIPLTENWLNRFGFKLQTPPNSDHTPFMYKEDFNLYFDPTDTGYSFATRIDYDGDFKSGYSVDTVSQLQNLYYSLTRKELKYEV